MWSGGVIDIRDGRDLVNVVFQSRHLNKIIVRLEMSSLFKNFHSEDRENLLEVHFGPLGISLFMRKGRKS
jgi:hypothetical protein